MEHEIFRVGIGNALFMQDNASPHRAIATKQYFYKRAIQLLRRLANLLEFSAGLKASWQMIACIKGEWARIKLGDIQKYRMNMQQRCEAVIQARGGHTPY